METGNENSPAVGLDAIHEQAVATANGTAAALEGAVAPGGPESNGGADPSLHAKATLTALCEIVSKAVSGHFLSELQKVTSFERANRIAQRTVMEAWQKESFVASGVLVAEKYGWTKLISPELALLGVVVGYGSQVMAARGDIQELLREIQATKEQGK